MWVFIVSEEVNVVAGDKLKLWLSLWHKINQTPNKRIKEKEKTIADDT